MKLSRTLRGLCLCLFYGCVWSCNFNKVPNKPQLSEKAKQLFSDYWNWRIKDTPEYATRVGIHDYDDLLDDLSEKAYQSRLAKCRDFLQRARLLEPSLEDRADIINIRVLIYELQTYIDGYHLKGHYFPIDNHGRTEIEMAKLLFTAMLRNSPHDYDKMISRLQLLPVQIDQIIALMKSGVRNGITSHNLAMRHINESLGKFVVDNPTESPFYVYFYNEYPDNFTETLIADIQTRAKEAINKVTAAYEKLRVYVTEEYKTRSNIAITTISNGKEFYDRLINFYTSTNLTAEQVQAIGSREVKRIEEEMQKVIEGAGYGNLSTQQFTSIIRNDPRNYYNTSEDMIQRFRYIISDLVQPRLKNLFNFLPSIKLEVAGDPSPFRSGASYRSGSTDGLPGVFTASTHDLRIQPRYSMLSLTLHEGNPGHHLQASYILESSNFPYFRQYIDTRFYGLSPSRFPLYTYFKEGWALYAESLGFDMDLYKDPLERYGHYSMEIYRACRLVVDTGIHAMGWTRDQAVQYMLDHTALSETKIQKQIDRYIMRPGQALGYKIGQLKISELRATAEKLLGTKFSIKDFHDVILSSFGPLDLLEEEVNNWISETLQPTSPLHRCS